MKSRDLPAIIFAGLTVAFVVVVLSYASARAGELEHDVIVESWVTFIEAPAAEAGTDVEPYLADILDIASDTTQDSYCEALASGYAFYIATYQDVVDMEEYDAEVYSAMVTAVEIVAPELDRIATACLEE